MFKTFVNNVNILCDCYPCNVLVQRQNKN